MKTRLIYLSPEIETLSFTLEANFCAPSGVDTQNTVVNDPFDQTIVEENW